MLTAAWAAGGALAGLIAGSFIATLVLRWPDGRGLGGRSSCDACGARLGVAELIPVVSYDASGGKCRQCRAPISAVHPVVEIACALVGAVALGLEPGLDGAAGALFGWMLVALAALDLRAFWLPDMLTGMLAILAVAAAFTGLEPAPLDRLIGGGIAFAALELVRIGYRLARGREGLGQGDPKLFGAIGLWLGWQPLGFVLLLASAIGLSAVGTMMLRGRNVDATTRLPFGAMLAAAAFIVWSFSRSV